MIVARKPLIHVPGADFGGQVELAALLAKGDKAGHRTWTRAAIEGVEFLRDRQIRRNLVRAI